METDGKNKSKRDILKDIDPSDALYILKVLMEEDKKFEDKIYQIAVKMLSEVDSDDIAVEVYNELDRLEVEELWDRSGKTRYGHVEPSEEAWVMFEEVLKPFVEEMKKYQKLIMFMEAKNYCIGIIKGIQEYEQESKSEFKDWAIDVPAEYIVRIMDEWMKGNPDSKDIAEVEEIARSYTEFN